MTSLSLFNVDGQIFLACESKGQLLLSEHSAEAAALELTHRYATFSGPSGAWDAGGVLHWMQLQPRFIEAPTKIDELITLGLLTRIDHQQIYRLDSAATRGQCGVLCDGPQAQEIYKRAFAAKPVED